jgi:CubicO group peptidase (beta-lactamase class C family)
MRNAKVPLLVGAVVLLGALGTVLAAQQQNAAIDNVFAAWNTRDSPGCAVALFRDGKIVYERGYGMADLEHDVPITPETVFYVGSLSKQFTAFAAALAIQQGKLGLDDPIRKHLPELPDYTAPITVRHLVHHTSGLRDFYTLLSIAGRRQDALFDNRAVLELASRQKGLNFPPGTDYLYSNTGYALLATIIGRVSGMPFAAFAEQQIFKPLGMTSTHFHDDDARLVKGRAFGYARTASGELRLDTPAGERVGAGGVFSTVRDLLRWDENFYDAKVGGRALIADVQKVGTLSTGAALTYAWGLQIGAYRGLPIVEHGGSLGGYRAHLIRFPEQHTTVTALCNLGTIAPTNLARQVADVALADRFAQPKPSPAAAAAAAAAAAGPGRGAGASNAAQTPTLTSPSEYAGTYVSDEIGSTFVVSVNDGQLMVLRDADTAPAAATLQPATADEFRFRTMTLRFERDASRKVTALLVDAGRVRGIRFARR